MIAFLRRHWFWFAVAAAGAVYLFFPRVRTVIGTVTEGEPTITYGVEQ